MEYLLRKLRNQDISKRIYVVGIDGLGGAGKSTIVNSLKLQLQKEKYHTYVLHIDDFIHLKHIRYDKSKEEWDCYYNIQWRYDYLVKEILSPVKREDKIDKLIELYDKENDGYIKQQILIEHGTVLLLEGIFLQRKEIKSYLDFIIYLDVPQEVRLSRVLKRDGYIGGLKDIKCKYERRYFPAEEKYILDYSPIENADFVVKYEEKCMKRSFVLWIVFFLVITNIVFISTTMWCKAKLDNQEFKVYSFQGENTDIRVTDGLIILFPNKHIVSGGNIQYIGSKEEQIESYSESIYLDKEGDKDIVLLKTVSIEMDNKGTYLSDEFLLNKSIGEKSSQQLFNEEQVELIKNNLYFNLNYLKDDGQTRNFIVKLNVKEFNMNENK